jgi:hypothetical protein
MLPRASWRARWGYRQGHFSQQPAILKFRMFKPDPENWVIHLFICAFAFIVLNLLWPYILGCPSDAEARLKGTFSVRRLLLAVEFQAGFVVARMAWE